MVGLHRKPWWRLTLAVSLIFVFLAAGTGESGAEPPEVPPGLDRAIDAKERHADALMSRSGVVGVGVGVNDSGAPVVRVLLQRAGVAGLPAAVDGVPVDTVITGLIEARCDSTTDDCDPAPLGVSIGHPDITAGTLGALVTDGSNVFILSNNHVLAAANDGSIGDNSLQPGPFDGGSDPADAIGTLAAYVPIDFSGGPNEVDAAITLTTANLVLNETLPSLGGYGTPTSTPVAAEVGMSVQKCGRTTGCTLGTVSEIMLDVSVCYETRGPFRCVKSALFEDQIGITDSSFSAGGDSGSLIVDVTGNPDPVGLLFAGSSTRTIANHITDVLNSLNVTMYQGTLDAAPTVNITNPADGAAVSGTVTVTADASDDNGVTQVEFFVDGGSIGTDSNGGDGWSAEWDTTTSGDGNHTVSATATDTASQTATDSVNVTVDNVDDPPTVTVTNPAGGSTVSGTVTVTADASDDGGVTQVEFFVDGGSIGTDSNGGDGWSAEWDTTTSGDGNHTVSATATDTASQTATDSVNVTVDNSGVILTGQSINNGRTWTAQVTSSGETLNGIWSYPAPDTPADCTGNTCTLGGIPKREGSVVFTASTGEQITISKP